MDLTDTLPEDELLLARLTVTKLAKVMHGLLSVGAASLETDDPASFLRGREKTPLGFVEVLGCIGAKPGHADQIAGLRERARDLSRAVSDCHGWLLRLAEWRVMGSEEVTAAVERLGVGYTGFCRQLTEFGTLLGARVDYAEQADQLRTMLEAAFQTVTARCPRPHGVSAGVP